MNYNTFERAIKLVNDFDLDELKESLNKILVVKEEGEKEKIEQSNSIRQAMTYYILNRNTEKDIEEVDEELERLNKEIESKILSKGSSVYLKAQSKLILKVRLLKKERDHLVKVNSDSTSKVKIQAQNLIDTYISLESIERKMIDLANAIYIIEESSEHGIKYKKGEIEHFKEVYDFLIGKKII